MAIELNGLANRKRCSGYNWWR